MKCLSNLNNYAVPNDVIVTLSKIYRFIGNNDYYIKSLGSDISKVIELTVEKDAYYLSKLINLDITEARSKLIISKDSSPRNKEETTLYNIKELLIAFQQKYQSLRLQSNDLHNTINYVYSHYSSIKFVTNNESRTLFQLQEPKSKRLILDEMNETVEKYINSSSFDKIILFLHYFIDLFNLKPFTNRNETLSFIILYQLVLSSDLNAFKYVSFFELLYNDYNQFNSYLCKASINWVDGYAQTSEFVRYFLSLILKAYKKADQTINNYKFDRTNKKYENIEAAILSMSSTFTKDEIRLLHPYVSESTINRALINLKEEGLIKPLGKGRSAKWLRIK